MPELIKVSHKIRHSNSFLFYFSSQPSEKVGQILRNITGNSSFVRSWPFLKPNEGISVCLGDKFGVFVIFVDVPYKLIVVDFI